MPHLIVELSRNLAEQVSPQKIVDDIHRAACGTGSLPVNAVKTRAIVHDLFAVGDPDAQLDAFFDSSDPYPAGPSR